MLDTSFTYLYYFYTFQTKGNIDDRSSDLNIKFCYLSKMWFIIPWRWKSKIGQIYLQTMYHHWSTVEAILRIRMNEIYEVDKVLTFIFCKIGKKWRLEMVHHMTLWSLSQKSTLKSSKYFVATHRQKGYWSHCLS